MCFGVRATADPPLHHYFIFVQWTLDVRLVAGQTERDPSIALVRLRVIDAAVFVRTRRRLSKSVRGNESVGWLNMDFDQECVSPRHRCT